MMNKQLVGLQKDTLAYLNRIQLADCRFLRETECVGLIQPAVLKYEVEGQRILTIGMK